MCPDTYLTAITFTINQLGYFSHIYRPEPRKLGTYASMSYLQ